jgi:hypothetical protein
MGSEQTTLGDAVRLRAAGSNLSRRGAVRTTASTRCTTLTPTANVRAVFCFPTPSAASSRMQRSTFGAILGRPSLDAFALALASPAFTRPWISERSNSANTPSGQEHASISSGFRQTTGLGLGQAAKQPSALAAYPDTSSHCAGTGCVWGLILTSRAQGETR